MEGKIVKIISNLYTVEVNGKRYECRARGKFYHEKQTPLVGDYVKVDLMNNYILALLPRKNILDRPNIANVDSAIIITSVRKPDLDLILLDKLLSLVVHNKIEPIICFTKLDLLSFKEKLAVKKIMKYYHKVGFKVVDNTKLRKLTKLIAGKIVVLTGQTGSGKSTLLNKLDPSLDLATNEISEALGRGKHTTRHVELFKYWLSYIADTPGFSALELNTLKPSEIRDTFPEFKVKCEYQDCMHHKEEHCEVKELVQKGKILKSRYQNYLKFGGM